MPKRDTSALTGQKMFVLIIALYGACPGYDFGVAGELLTDRLDLRAVEPDDLDALHRIRADPRNCAYLPTGPHEDPEVTRAWITRSGRRWETHGIGYWTVRLRSTAEVVGVGGVDRRPAFWNLYYLIDANHAGRGYATELARAAMRAAAARHPDLPLAAWIHAGNFASQAVARHLGLRDYGLAERDHWKGEPMHLWSDSEPASPTAQA